MKKLTALLLSLFLIFSLSACAGTQEPAEPELSQEEPEKPAYAVKYHVKINPELDVYADENLNVLWVEAVNADAEALLANVRLEGLPVSEAFSVITEEAKAEGFLTEEKGNTVQITVDELVETAFSYEVCPICGGGGKLVCWDCGGTTLIPCGCDHGRVECYTCHGAGNRSCECGGEPVVCEDCGGEGHVVCDQCGGAGTLTNTCKNCGGTGRCPDCGGRGYVIVTAGDTGNIVYKADGTPETGSCQGCHSTGICQVCSNNPFCPACCEHVGPDGDIRNPGATPGIVTCRSCSGSGTTVCGECGGRGDFPCEDCGGSGSTVCPYCNGGGPSPCGCDGGYVWCPCCWGSGVKGSGIENYDYSLSPQENAGR